jgi:N-acetylneuraminate synthase
MRFVQEKGSIFISTPFSRAAAERLKKFDVPAYKIGSGECNNYPLVKHIASFGKPIILSTGMNTISSVSKSVQIMEDAGVPYALLHTTNIYPTPYNLVRLNAMSELQNSFPNAVVGLSDHTTSNHTCFGAVALGASILERHFTDSMQRIGPDISCSMDPKALNELVEGSLNIYYAKGHNKEPVAEEAPTIAFAFASVVAIKDIKIGETLNEDNIWVKRPGGGDFNADEFDSLIGKRAIQNIESGYQIKKTQIDI